jgi:F-type H+-transporting ATPase subunit gamma
MQTLESLKKKIKTAEDLQSVVKTMKALAAVNIRQYERAVESLADYHRTVEMGLQVLLSQRPVGLQFRRGSRERWGVIVFGSDQGMCGQLNDQIVNHALEDLDRREVGRDDRVALAVGLRAAGRLEDAGQSVEETFSVPGSTSGITPMVQELLLVLEAWPGRDIGHVVLYFSEHLSGASYRPHSFLLLPMDEEWLVRIRARRWPSRCLPLFTMDWDRLFSRLIRQYLFVSLYRAFAESLASENASRLSSMHGAERNIEERLAGLQGQFLRQRQMSITEELLDIVSGYEALTDPKQGRTAT